MLPQKPQNSRLTSPIKSRCTSDASKTLNLLLQQSSHVGMRPWKVSKALPSPTMPLRQLRQASENLRSPYQNHRRALRRESRQKLEIAPE